MHLLRISLFYCPQFYFCKFLCNFLQNLYYYAKTHNRAKIIYKDSFLWCKLFDIFVCYRYFNHLNFIMQLAYSCNNATIVFGFWRVIPYREFQSTLNYLTFNHKFSNFFFYFNKMRNISNYEFHFSSYMTH